MIIECPANTRLQNYLLEKDIHVLMLSNQDHPLRLQLGYVTNLALHLSEIGNDFLPSQGQLCQYLFKGLFYLFFGKGRRCALQFRPCFSDSTEL